MVRKLILAGGVLVVFLALSIGPVQAGRLGGAYRGPYEDNQVTKNDLSQDVTSTGKAEPPKASGSGGDTGKGDAGAGDGSGGDTGGGDTGGGSTPPPGDAAPPTDSGGAGGTATKEPPKPDKGQSGLDNGGSGRSGKTAVEEVLAYWPFWFEHNKEWLLEGIFRERSARAKVSPESSPFQWLRGFGAGVRTPVTEEQRMKVILPLLRKFSTHESSWVRDAAVLALGKLGVPEAVQDIAARLQDKDPDVVEDACLALGLTRDKAALDPLVSSLNNVDRRPYAALGLGLLGRTEAVPALLTAYADAYRAPAGDTRALSAASCIAIALGGIGDQAVVNDLAPRCAARRSTSAFSSACARRSVASAARPPSTGCARP